MSRVFVITGSGSGLGKTFAQRFASDGDNVVLLGRTLAKIEAVAAEIGDSATAIACDVQSPDSVREAFTIIAEKFPGIDVLINNAASVPHAMLNESTDEEIINAFSTNCMGTIFCSRAAVPLMKNGSHIINISSGAVDSKYPGMSVYAASKAGMEVFSEAMFTELQPLGIKVTALRCGQMVEDKNTWMNDPEIKKMIQKAIDNGLDPLSRPSSNFASVAEVVRNLIDMPADLSSPIISLKPRKE